MRKFQPSSRLAHPFRKPRFWGGEEEELKKGMRSTEGFLLKNLMVEMVVHPEERAEICGSSVERRRFERFLFFPPSSLSAPASCWEEGVFAACPLSLLSLMARGTVRISNLNSHAAGNG